MLEHFIISGVCIVIFILGIIVQKYCISGAASISSPKSFIKQQNSVPQTSISLDETKVVLKIDTSNLEKKTDLVGHTTITQNDTTNAIDKLKSMKGK